MTEKCFIIKHLSHNSFIFVPKENGLVDKVLIIYEKLPNPRNASFWLDLGDEKTPTQAMLHISRGCMAFLKNAIRLFETGHEPTLDPKCQICGAVITYVSACQTPQRNNPRQYCHSHLEELQCEGACVRSFCSRHPNYGSGRQRTQAVEDALGW